MFVFIGYHTNREVNWNVSLLNKPLLLSFKDGIASNPIKRKRHL